MRSGGALDVAVGDLVGGLGAGGGEREGGFEEDVGLVPVDCGGDADEVGVGVEGDVLDEVGLAPGAGDADGRAQGAVVGEELDRVEWSMGVMGRSRVPGSMFQASYSLGVSMKVWSWLPQALRGEELGVGR